MQCRVVIHDRPVSAGGDDAIERDGRKLADLGHDELVEPELLRSPGRLAQLHQPPHHHRLVQQRRLQRYPTSHFFVFFKLTKLKLKLKLKRISLLYQNLGINDLKASGALPTTPTSGVRAPEGEVTIVFSDITRAASLWEFNADAMRDATILHNQILRSLLSKHHVGAHI